MNDVDIETIEAHFDKVGTSTPFFVHFDSKEAFSTSDNELLRYVKYEREPSWELIRPNLFNLRMNLLEQL